MYTWMLVCMCVHKHTCTNFKIFPYDFWPVSHISACTAKPVFKNLLGEAKPLRWAELGPGHEETEPHQNSDHHTARSRVPDPVPGPLQP